MRLQEEIKKIKKLIMELSPNSYGVGEFLDFVRERPEVLSHLKFTSFEDLEDYIQDGNIKDFNELRMEVENFIQSRKEYVESEIDEIERVVQHLSREEGINVSVSELVDMFENTPEVTISDDIINRLENTECNRIKKGELKKVIELAKRYNKYDPLGLKKSLINGDYKRPLILKFGDRYHLVAGNTRLCTASALGMKLKVLIVDLGE